VLSSPPVCIGLTMRVVCRQRSIYSIPVVACSRLRSSPQYRSWKAPSHIFHSTRSVSLCQDGFPNRRCYSIDRNASPSFEDVYIREVDLEDFEDYTIGGYNPTVIGDHFHDGRYEVVPQAWVQWLFNKLACPGQTFATLCLVEDPSCR
jgi:hypothetical protein